MAIILIIEDNLDIRENIAEILELEGHKVITADNGQKGIELTIAKKPDLIFCDIRMPFMDGYEVLKQLKQNKSVTKIPFIYITASTEKKDMQIGIDLGASAYLNKPFEVQELLNLVNSLLKTKIHN